METIEGKRIVVAITTRNRPEVFDVCLAHFKTFRSASLPTRYLILDDNSSPENRVKNEASAKAHGFADAYQYSDERLGIARAKNECLRRTYSDGDFFFLFDDDAFPRKAGWERLYLDKSVTHGCHHLLYCADVGPYVTVGDTHGISEYNAPLGVLMFVTKKCLDVVGGFNEDFGIYGNEHIKYTNRVHASGLTNGFGRIVVPRGCAEYIYAFDIDWCMKREPPPLRLLPGEFRASLADEPLEEYRIIADHAWNRLEQSPVYEPLFPETCYNTSLMAKGALMTYEEAIAKTDLPQDIRSTLETPEGEARYRRTYARFNEDPDFARSLEQAKNGETVSIEDLRSHLLGN